GLCSLLCFFFQAEDGIRDFHVTGVQTCALPILTITENDNNVIEDLTFANVEVIAERLMTAFTEGVYDRIVLVYNSFRNAATQVVLAEQFLPILPKEVEQQTGGAEISYIFEPSKEEIIEELIPK